MTEFIAQKVINALPAPLEPNAVYFVRSGTGFEMRVSDNTGGIAHTLNSPFLPSPDLIDEEDPTFFYFGFADIEGAPAIQRQDRETAQTLTATGFADLTTAFENRTTLTYS